MAAAGGVGAEIDGDSGVGGVVIDPVQRPGPTVQNIGALIAPQYVVAALTQKRVVASAAAQVVCANVA